MPADDSPASSRLAKVVVVAAWIAVAVIANVLFALAPAKSSGSALLPSHQQPTGRAAKAFPGTGTNAFAYLVLEGRGALGADDQQYYDAAVAALRADTRHVGSVLDWWSDPLTAPMGASRDGRSATALVWLVGEAGSTQARDSLQAARAVVRKLPPAAGVSVRITVPATTNGTPLRLSAWQGAAIVAAVALVAALLLLRVQPSRRAAGTMLATAGLSAAVAWPLTGLAAGCLGSAAVTVFSGTLAAVLTIGIVTAATLQRARSRLALPGLCTALLTGPLLLARTPALHGVGTAVLGVVVALAASLTLLPTLLPAPGRGVEAAPPPRPSLARSAVVIAAVLAVCALPVLGMRWGLAEEPGKPAQALPGNPLPGVLLVESDHDLRDPAGLIAIDQVSHRLMEIPGVRKVQSAAWPAGVPWSDASLTSAMGRLSDQLDRGAGSFMPQVNAIKSLGAIVDQMNGALNELDKSMNVALAGANEIQRNVDVLLAETGQIRGVTGQVSRYMEPVRGWVGGVENCPADMVCSAVGKVVTNFDKVITEVTSLTNAADHIGAVSRSTIGAFSSAPRVMADMKSALAKLSTFVPNLETTIQNTLPQIVQVSTFLKGVATDFANTGEGGFYMSRKSLADPSYQHVRQAMFSPDGTVTRLFVYSDGAKLDLNSAARTQDLETAAGKAMKYGSLLDAKLSVAGAAQVGTAVRDAVRHDAVLLGLMLLAAAGLVGLWRGAASGVVVGLGTLASCLAALGISIALWQHLLGHELQASVPLVSFAILAACGVPYLVARELTPLVTLGAVFGVGLLVVSAFSVSALSQLGTVLVIGLLALTAVARAWLPAAPRS